MRFLYSRSLMLVFLGIVIGNVTAAAFVSAWTSPTQAPPNGNTPTPLNVGSGNQTKTGGMLQVYDLWVNGAMGVTGGISSFQYCFSGGTNCITQWPTSQLTTAGTSLYYNSGNFGLGTSTPGTLFSVQGVTNFTTATSTFFSSGGINLTSGCFAIQGVCIQTTQWLNNGTSIYYSAGNVGIGTASPSTKLEVNGPIRPGNATVGTACSPEGANAYDIAAHLPVYCNQSGIWASVASAGGVFAGKYTNYTSSSARALGVTYTNTGTTPRLVIVSAESTCGVCGRVNVQARVDSVIIAQISAVDGNGSYGFLSMPTAVSFVVPAGSTYSVSVTSSGQKDYWVELQ